MWIVTLPRPFHIWKIEALNGQRLIGGSRSDGNDTEHDPGEAYPVRFVAFSIVPLYPPVCSTLLPIHAQHRFGAPSERQIDHSVCPFPLQPASIQRVGRTVPYSMTSH